MRIIKYTTHLDNDRKPILIKENSSNYPNVCRLDSPQKITDMINTIYNASVLTEEYMWMIALDTKCNPIGIFEISHGTVNASLISPREIFMRLCLCGATNFVLIHNHPSGDITPSKEDINVTTQMKEAGKLMNINLLDHIIIGDIYYSFRENNNVICN